MRVMSSEYTDYQENEPNADESVNQENPVFLSLDTKAEEENKEDSIKQQLRKLRKQVQQIENYLDKSEEFDDLIKITTIQVREKIACERVIIYRFTNPENGIVIAESINNGWTPAIRETLPAIIYGLGNRQEYLEPISIGNMAQEQLTPYQAQLIEKFQVKASLTLPILLQNEVWGLLVIHSCSQAREWQEAEINLLSQVSIVLTHKLQAFEWQKKLEKQEQQHKSVAKIIDRIQRVSSLDKIFQAATQEVRSLIQCDRVGVYRFNQNWGGEFIAESVASGWVSLVGPGIKTSWEDTHLQQTQGGRYRSGETLAVADIYKMGHSQCHLDVLEQFQVKAYAIVPVFSGQKLWGLLAAYQNSATREWLPWEIDLLTQFGVHFGVAVSHLEYIEQVEAQSMKLVKTNERQQNLISLTRKIGEILAEKFTHSSQLEAILQITVTEVRKLLQTDRTAIYRFNPDWSGEFIAESLGNGWTSFKDKNIDKSLLKENGHCDSISSLGEVYKARDTHLKDTKAGRYQKKTSFVVNDVSQQNFPSCYMELLEQFEAKAYLTVPLFKDGNLWGLLANYQHSTARNWEEVEVSAMNQIAVLLGLAMQQAETLEKFQKQSEEVTKIAEKDRAISKVIDKIRQSNDIDSIFDTTTKEVRTIIDAERVVLYRFNPDWSGMFISESAARGWTSLIEKQNQIKSLQESISDCNGMQSLIHNSLQNFQVTDTHLQESQGGGFRQGNIYTATDVYEAGFSSCYVDVLEQYQVRSYAIVPIFQGQKLWGMFAAYQNSAPRKWEESEVNVLVKIADQLGLALQQVEFLQQLQSQSERVTQAAGREKAAKEVLQKGAMQLLSAVRPALNGDLTVRAPITEDELGTIADAYNNTLQALRQIVIQVQKAAEEVAMTSNNSNASLGGLTNLARQQSSEINEALREIQQMVDSTQAVVSNAELVQVAVQQANHTVESGDTAMNKTVEAIQGIRETVAQTSKKIKRLSESSQKISKVVNLIGNFATQTNVLALNAAIEATRAGEYGKGFAVVADEVRSLSRQSAAATIEIEKLVQEIQEETGEVAVAMETGIQQVVEGTNLVNETRQNLNAIVAATAEISELLQRITESNQAQMLQSVSVTASMKDVAKIASKTSAEANNITTVFHQLSDMAQELLSSVSKFKVK
jgi:methyl-accepting chemotaxis protein PixJ